MASSEPAPAAAAQRHAVDDVDAVAQREDDIEEEEMGGAGQIAQRDEVPDEDEEETGAGLIAQREAEIPEEEELPAG